MIKSVRLSSRSAIPRKYKLTRGSLSLSLSLSASLSLSLSLSFSLSLALALYRRTPGSVAPRTILIVLVRRCDNSAVKNYRAELSREGPPDASLIVFRVPVNELK